MPLTSLDRWSKKTILTLTRHYVTSSNALKRSVLLRPHRRRSLVYLLLGIVAIFILFFYMSPSTAPRRQRQNGAHYELSHGRPAPMPVFLGSDTLGWCAGWLRFCEY